MNRIPLKSYIGWVVAIICALIAGKSSIQKEHLQLQNDKLIQEKMEIHNTAKTIQQYVITNNFILPDPVKLNFLKILTSTSTLRPFPDS